MLCDVGQGFLQDAEHGDSSPVVESNTRFRADELAGHVHAIGELSRLPLQGGDDAKVKDFRTQGGGNAPRGVHGGIHQGVG